MTRQLGAAFELAAQHLWWISLGAPIPALAEAAQSFNEIATASKAPIQKGPRLAANKGAFSDQALFDLLSLAWRRGMAALDGEVG